LYPKKKWFLLTIGIILSLVIPILIRNLIEQHLYPSIFGFQNYFGHTWISYLRDNLYFSFKYIVTGIGFFLITYSFFKEKRAHALEIENQKMAEAQLRSQVNPHFLLNSLNNIYSLIYQKSDKSLEAVDKLSDILKYTLYTKKEKVQLKEELDQLDQYFDLQKMRYDFPVEIKKEIDPAVLNFEIPQLLLLPLIENAFKHGNLKDSPVLFNIKPDADFLKVEVSNKIGLKEKDSSSGIGLDNVQKRLELIYDSKAYFNAQVIDEDFLVDIKIPLK